MVRGPHFSWFSGRPRRARCALSSFEQFVGRELREHADYGVHEVRLRDGAEGLGAESGDTATTRVRGTAASRSIALRTCAGGSPRLLPTPMYAGCQTSMVSLRF